MSPRCPSPRALMGWRCPAAGHLAPPRTWVEVSREPCCGLESPELPCLKEGRDLDAGQETHQTPPTSAGAQVLHYLLPCLTPEGRLPHPILSRPRRGLQGPAAPRPRISPRRRPCLGRASGHRYVQLPALPPGRACWTPAPTRNGPLSRGRRQCPGTDKAPVRGVTSVRSLAPSKYTLRGGSYRGWAGPGSQA